MVNLYITQTKPFIAQNNLLVGVSEGTKGLEKNPKVKKYYSKYKIEAEDENILWINKTIIHDEICCPKNLISAVIPKGTEYWICDNFGIVISKKIIKFPDSPYNPKGKREAFAKDILKQSGSFKPGWVKKNHSLVSNPEDDVIGVFGGNTPEGKQIIVGISDYESYWDKTNKRNFSGRFFSTPKDAIKDFRRNIEFLERPEIYKIKSLHDWYLPPLGELKTVMTQLIWVNAEIILAGGKIIGGSMYWGYWSSTEYDDPSCSWRCGWGDGDCWWSSRVCLGGVRCFLDAPTRKGGVEILIKDEEHITLPLPRSDVNLQVGTPCTVNFNFH